MAKSKDGNHWIQKAVSKHPGALTKKADKAHETPKEYARKHKGDKGKTGKESRLALTLGKISKKNSRKSSRRG